jgi:bifunctional non-homologous end joining protein LigD
VFDLDPGAGVAWDFVIETAGKLRELLREEGFDSRPKLTGGNGLHLMVPIARGMSHEKRSFGGRLAGRERQCHE